MAVHGIGLHGRIHGASGRASGRALSIQLRVQRRATARLVQRHVHQSSAYHAQPGTAPVVLGPQSNQAYLLVVHRLPQSQVLGHIIQPHQ